LAYCIETGSGIGDVWILDLETNLPSRLTFSEEALDPVWSPDGRFLHFASIRGGGEQGLYRKPSDGSGDEELVALVPEIFMPSGIGPDEQTILITAYSPIIQVLVIKLQDDGTATRGELTTGSNYSWGAVYSPNYRWIAYTSNESGRNEVYVVPASGSGKWQISTDGGMSPVWGPDGRELFFADYRGVHRAEVSTEGEFGYGRPTLLFSGNFLLLTPPETNFDISRDGEKFVFVQAGELSKVDLELYVVLNWFEKLKRLVPTGK
jgi:dipeptidyl aminopeptidase/acylaminoacyl peptidase